MKTDVDQITIDLMALADLGQPLKLAFELHRQIRDQYGVVPLRVPLEQIARAVGIVGIKEFNTDRFEGTLVVTGNDGAVGLRRGMPSGRYVECGPFVARAGTDSMACRRSSGCQVAEGSDPRRPRP
jgi:hypothetical protein